MWRRWGTPQNLKNKYSLKKLLKWANKKQNNLNIYNVALKKKIKKNTQRNNYQNLNDMIYSSWDIEQNRLKLVILGHFLSFYPLKSQNIKSFEKWKNLVEIPLFYTSVPKITIIWCTVPDIRSETDRTFWHFGPFFALLSP